MNYEYDKVGNVIKEQIKDGETKLRENVYSYDNRNRVAESTADGESYAMYTYDGIGNITKLITGSKADLANAEVTQYTYNEQNLPLEIKDAMGQSEYYAYDAMGNIISKTDRNGATVKYTYDEKNQLKEESYADGTVVSYTYNKGGMLIGKTESKNNKTVSYATYEYDDKGRITKETLDGVEKCYIYDLDDKMTELNINRDGKNLIGERYYYDTIGRLSAVQKEGTDILVNYTYDAVGNVIKRSTGNGVVTNYTYNKSNQLTSLENKNGNEIINSYAYDYYKDGNVKSITENTGKITNYEYDIAGRLKKETETQNGEASEKTYSYDVFGNRAGMKARGAETSYTYDKNNRLTNETTVGANLKAASDYIYDNNGNKIFKFSSEIKTRENKQPSFSVGEAGFESGYTESYSYDVRNRLQQVNKNGVSSTYSYDVNGLRNSKTVDGVTTKQVWSGGQMMLELNGDNSVKAKYYRGNELIASKLDNSGLNYYVYSGHGDVTALTNESGAIIADYTYDAFGNQTSANENDIYNPFRYCGEYYDEESGLIYLRNRYYDPEIGRFINEDPIRDGLNWYSYCSGNPVAFVDPSGLGPEMLKYAIDSINSKGNCYFELEWDDTTKTATVMSGGKSTGVSYGASDYKIVGGRMIVDSYGLENDLRGAGYNVNSGDAEYCSATKENGNLQVSCDIGFISKEDAAIQMALLLNDYSKQDRKEYGMQIFKKGFYYTMGDKVYASTRKNNYRSVDVPGGQGVVGIFHTHWVTDEIFEQNPCMEPGAVGFSNADKIGYENNYLNGFRCEYFVVDKYNGVYSATIDRSAVSYKDAYIYSWLGDIK